MATLGAAIAAPVAAAIGIAADDGLVMTPARLDFGYVRVGGGSPAQDVTVANRGTTALTISNAVTAGDFVTTDHCGNTLAAGQSCTYSVVFRPSARGRRTGSLTLTDSSPSGSHSVALVAVETRGYNILTSGGGIYSFGNATYHGNLIDHGYPGPAVGLSETPSGRGYAILTAPGAIYTFGDAPCFGNLLDHGYPGPAVALAYTPSGRGYSILTDSGALYSFGDAPYWGNLLDYYYPGPAASLAWEPGGNGYNILNSGGGIYSYGEARYFGNLIDHGYPGRGRSLGPSMSGLGYAILTDAGTLYTFGDMPYMGNLVDHGYPGPATAISTVGAAGTPDPAETPPPPPRPASRVLSVPYYRQAYPLSCEEAALQMALAYRGIASNQGDILNVIGIDYRRPYRDQGGFHWGDPYAAFVGDPNGSESNYTGYGTYFPTIARAARQYGATVRFADEGYPASAVYDDILNGHPVIAWVSFDYQWHSNTSYVAFDGRTVQFGAPYEHAVTIIGVSPDSVLVNDPHAGQMWVSRGTFETAYGVFRNMAVTLD